MDSSRTRSRWIAVWVTIAMVLTSVAAIVAPTAQGQAGAGGPEPECSAVMVRGVQVGSACPTGGVAPLAVHIVNTSTASCTPQSLAPKPDAIRLAFGDGEYIQAAGIFGLVSGSCHDCFRVT